MGSIRSESEKRSGDDHIHVFHLAPSTTAFVRPHLRGFLSCLALILVAKHAEPLAPSPAGHARSSHISFGLDKWSEQNA